MKPTKTSKVPNAFDTSGPSLLAKCWSKEYRFWRQPGTGIRNMPEIKLPGSLDGIPPELMTKRKSKNENK